MVFNSPLRPSCNSPNVKRCGSCGLVAPVVSSSDAVNLALSAGGIVTISGLSFGESSFTPTASVSGTLFLFIGGVVI
jgi:hypothetical protein